MIVWNELFVPWRSSMAVTVMVAVPPSVKIRCTDAPLASTVPSLLKSHSMVSIVPSGSVAVAVNRTTSPTDGRSGVQLKEGTLGRLFAGGSWLLTWTVLVLAFVRPNESVTSNRMVQVPAWPNEMRVLDAPASSMSGAAVGTPLVGRDGAGRLRVDGDVLTHQRATIGDAEVRDRWIGRRLADREALLRGGRLPPEVAVKTTFFSPADM